MCVHTLSALKQSDYCLEYCNDLVDTCDYVDITEKSISSDKNFSIIQLNIRSILGKQSQLTNCLKQTNKHSTAQVILLQETWLKKTQNQG